MNKIFKSVWSEALGAWVAASELCRGRGKGGGKVARALALAVGLGVAGLAFASGPGTQLSNTTDPTTTTNATDIAIGPNAAAQSTTKDAIAIGDTARSTADGAIGIGGSVQNKAANSIIMGNGGGALNAASLDSASSGSVFFAPAGGSVTTSANSFSFNSSGVTSTVGSDNAVNISGSVMNSPGGVAIGKNATVSKANGVAVGLGSSVTGVNAVAIGANSSATRANTVSVGSQGNTRQITQVANGVSAGDAVNVSQISGIADALGGGSVVNGAGLVTMPTYSVNGTDQQGVEQAISALDNTLSTAVMYDGVKDSVTLGGSSGTQIHNLAAATAPMDAVNFKQLTDAGLTVDTNNVVTNAFVAYTNKSMTKVSLGGSGGTTISNLAAGVAAQDAVNVKQLTDAGAVVDSTGAVTNAFVAYDGSTKDSVTLKGTNGTQIHKLAAGSADQDAVNVKQLKDAGAVVDSTGTVTNAFVAYDGSAKDSVTLKGANGTQIHKVAAGTAAQDAVNVKQLTDAGAVVDSTGTVTNAFVAYDGSAKDSVTLKGANGTQIHKVAAGTAAQDAVNVKQLTDAGAVVDSTGTVTNAFVAYDGSAKDSITLKGANGTQIHKVAAGTAAQDAVNVKQLTDAGAVVDSTGTVTNAFVAYDGSAKDSVTLKGANGTQIHKLAAGSADQDAVNVKQLKDAGANVDSSGNITNAFVAYDDSTMDSVTLRGTDGTQIHNVAAATEDMDAVNLK